MGVEVSMTLLTRSGQILCLALLRKDMSQRDMAKDLGVPPQNISRTLNDLVNNGLLSKTRVGRSWIYGPGPAANSNQEIKYLTELINSGYGSDLPSSS